MEFVAPTLSDVADAAAQDDVTVLRVLPLFLSAGAHVGQDIPAQANAARRRHPNLIVEVLAPIGEDPRFGVLLREIVCEAAKLG
jgi:sirohydrochlorin ferrochelatase